MIKETCPVCEKRITLTVIGTFRQHGPRNQWCKGSGQQSRTAGGLNGEEIADAFAKVAPGVEEIITVELVRSGQPRPYADHERVVRVTVRTFGWDGFRHESLRDADEYETWVAFNGQPRHPGTRTPDEYRRQLFEALRSTALRVLGASDLPTSETRDNTSMSGHFSTFVASVDRVGPYTVEVTIITPFTD